MKNKKMKENSFIQGAFIATLGIIISKILGIIYVIPFYAIIGTQGGALYGYAYNIYGLFLSISLAGLPLAMSKIISEYHTLGYHNAKEKAFILGKRLLNLLGLLSFLLLFIFAKPIATMIIGDVTGGNTVQDITTVIRVVSTAVLVVPILSVKRGYLQGHKFISPTSTAQVIEQLVRVIIIVFGSYLVLNVFKMDLTIGVSVALFAATIGALVSYFYLKIVIKKNKEVFESTEVIKKEPFIKSEEILKKLILYALPFVMIDIVVTLYNSVDIVTLVKILVNDFNYTTLRAESIMSVISTWGSKLNSIILSINTGILVSLIPHLTSSITLNNKREISNKINSTIQVILFLMVPMVFGLSLLSNPVWTIFYGNEAALSYGVEAYSYFAFVALASALFTTTITMVQVLKEYKMVGILLILGLTIKVLFNYPLIYTFNQLGLPAYYGAFTATLLGDIVPAILALMYLGKKFDINYKNTFKNVFKVTYSALIMVIVLLLLKNYIPLNSASRLTAMLITLIYATIGALIYASINLKNNLIQDMFGKDKLLKLKNKFIKK